MTVVDLNRNLRWYVWHQRVAGALFWAPTAFLFFVDRYGLSTALQIQSVYYLAVVGLELPSGRFSDRFGRVPTLRIAAGSWIAAHTIFVTTESAVGAAAGQILLAAGFAFISGTDVTFHYDTLEALGQESRYEERESAIRRQLLLAMASSAAIGGVLAFVDLRLPFVAAGVMAITQLGITLRFTRPPSHPSDRNTGLAATVTLLRRPLLAWIALYVVCQVVTIHLAAELGAPYLATVLDGNLDDPTTAAFVNGILAAAVALVGAATLRRLPQVTGRLGLTAALASIAFVPTILLIMMSVVTAAWLIPFLALRGVQSAASTVLIGGVVGATVDTGHRATFLSLTSLLGRLGYGVALLGLSAGASLSTNLTAATVVGVVAASAVVLTRLLLSEDDRQISKILEHDHDDLHHEHQHSHDDVHHDHERPDPGQGPHTHPHVHPALTHSHPLWRDIHHSSGS